MISGPPPPPLPKPKKSPLLVGILVGLPCFIVAAIAANWAMHHFREPKSNTTPGPAEDFLPASWRPHAAEEWKTYEYAGLRLETPFPLSETSELRDRLSPEVAGRFSEFQNFLGSRGDELNIMVQHMAVKEGLAPDFEGAVKGSVTGAAASIGDSNPDFTRRPLEVDGLKGARTSYQHAVQTRTLHHEQLILQRGQEIWNVVFVTTSENKEAIAERIFGSVHPLTGN